jgi:hypothetical protein
LEFTLSSVRRPLIGLAFGSVVLALAAACGGNAPAVPSGVPSIPTVPGVPTVAPDANLEALFPDTIGGNALEITSAQGEDVITQFASGDPDGFRTFISTLGVGMDKVSAGISFNIWPVPSSESDFTGLTIVALRVQGVPASTTLPAFIEFVKDDIGDEAEVSQQTVAGKTVTAVVDPEDAENSAFLYPSGDVVFLVGGTPNHVEEAFSKLP